MGFTNFAELLGNEQESKITLESKPPKLESPGGGPKVESKLEGVNVSTPPTDTKGIGQKIGDFLTDPSGRTVLAQLGAAFAGPQGSFTSKLASAAVESATGAQFDRLTAKMLAGEQLDKRDLVGISPELQERAFNIVRSKEQSELAKRAADVSEGEAVSKQALREAQVKGIEERPERELAIQSVREQGKLELEKLKQAGKLPKDKKLEQIDLGKERIYGYFDGTTFNELARGAIPPKAGGGLKKKDVNIKGIESALSPLFRAAVEEGVKGKFGEDLIKIQETLASFRDPLTGTLNTERFKSFLSPEKAQEFATVAEEFETRLNEGESFSEIEADLVERLRPTGLQLQEQIRAGQVQKVNPNFE